MESNTKLNYKAVLVLIIFLFLAIGISPFLAKDVKAYGECSQYGIWATYDYLTDSCKCMRGYIFAKGILGNTTCISMDQWCKDKYGYNSRYNSLTDKCECGSGYEMTKKGYGDGFECVSCTTKYGFESTYDYLTDSCKCMRGYIFAKGILGNTTCISMDQWCKDKYGYNSRYNSLTDKCECGSGYEMTKKGYGDGFECISCTTKYGFYSSYSYLSKKCECDDGYTLNDENECVEKQNNIYFILKEVNTDEKFAIIKSEYDNRCYSITYGYGCFSSTIRRYLNRRIVVNLGTDFDVDRSDKIILFDDDEVCDIKKVKRVYSDFTLEPEEDEKNNDSYINFIPTPTPTPALTPALTPTPTRTNNNNKKDIENIASEIPNKKSCKDDYALSLDKTRCVKLPQHSHIVNSPTDVWICDEGYKEVGNSCILARDPEFVVNQSDAQPHSQNVNTVLDLNKDNARANDLANESNIQNDEISQSSNKIQSIINSIPSNFVRLFKRITGWITKFK